ncbi:hypothetical protein P7C71_g3813, partial [Lecanoromycetidae sp. Uapishka_2]
MHSLNPFLRAFFKSALPSQCNPVNNHITPATLPTVLQSIKMSGETPKVSGHAQAETSSMEKKDIKTFNELLNNFPMISRQMTPGLEKVFNDFRREMRERPSPALTKSSNHSRRSSVVSTSSKSNGSIHSQYSNGHSITPSVSTLRVDEEEDHMRKSLESAVTAAIDLFQQVDKQQLSLVGATTDLTGPRVERLIERYITEQFHDGIIFPLLSQSRKLDDDELDSCIRGMQHIDIAQVGISIENGRSGKEQLRSRIAKGVGEFRHLGVAGSAQQMMDILLATQKIMTGDPEESPKTVGTNHSSKELDNSEKFPSTFTMNADTLVSLLLVVVIRSQVKHLHARLTYMRNFIFVDDIESGEMGYALSTFEAVLSYLASDSAGLRNASRRNKRLWQATRTGDVQDIKAILNPGSESRPNTVHSHLPRNAPLEGAVVADEAETTNRRPNAPEVLDQARAPTTKSEDGTLSIQRTLVVTEILRLLAMATERQQRSDTPTGTL